MGTKRLKIHGKKGHKAFEESQTFWAHPYPTDEGMLTRAKTRVASKLEIGNHFICALSYATLALTATFPSSGYATDMWVCPKVCNVLTFMAFFTFIFRRKI